ncbi:MAG: hypothetical protein JW755_08070 [Candidatus Aminicenantes bacterium]|nr:hypothetical protein [Candidatus Aminicenantes bacterium]
MKKLFLFLSLSSLIWITLLYPANTLFEDPEKFDQPVLITSAGQSAELQLANVLAKRAELAATLVKIPSANDLEGIKTVILVIGASLKGLGAAGLDVEQEKQRVSQLILSIKEKNLPIIILHLGGDIRRGDLSDELIASCLPHSRFVIVVKSGNHDGLFSSICEENEIPLIEVERTTDALAPLKDLFY